MDKEIIAMETTCKTRACPVCREKVKSKFQMLVEYGSLTLGPSLFITVTLKAGYGTMRDARYVARVWARLLVFWKSRYEDLAWVKVVELTDRKQPHLHVVAYWKNCWIKVSCITSDHAYDKRWRRMDCHCIEHTLSRDWFASTGDSFVVKVKAMASGGTAASYLSKYFAKDFLYQKDRLLLGFARSWSRSRSWPVDQLMLQATKEKQWVRTSFHPIVPKEGEKNLRNEQAIKDRNQWWLDHSIGSKHLLRTGTNLAMALNDRKNYERLKGSMSRIRNLLDNS